jgi:hypothetical protein
MCHERYHTTVVTMSEGLYAADDEIKLCSVDGGCRDK